MELSTKLNLTFEFFTQTISGFKNRDFTPTKREEVSIRNFANLLKERYSEGAIGSQWLFYYFSFQFEYWREKDTRTAKGLPKVEWVVGEKAFSRWLTKSKDFLYFCNEGVLKLNKELKQSKVKSLIQESPQLQSQYQLLQPWEEDLKNKSLNQKAGLVQCLTFTTLYHHRSLACQVCNFKTDCKALLLSNYPNIYNKRKYNQDEKVLENI